MFYEKALHLLMKVYTAMCKKATNADNYAPDWEWIIHKIDLRCAVNLWMLFFCSERLVINQCALKDKASKMCTRCRLELTMSAVPEGCAKIEAVVKAGAALLEISLQCAGEGEWAGRLDYWQ